MPPIVEVGTILIEEQPLMTQRLGLATEPYFANWSVVTALDGFALDRKARAAGWNFLFMAGEVTAIFWGLPEPTKIRSAVLRILKKVRPDHFNSLEITGAVGKHFLGIPYTIVTAHSRHLQQSYVLDGIAQRQGASESLAIPEVEIVFPPRELTYESR